MVAWVKQISQFLHLVETTTSSELLWLSDSERNDGNKSIGRQ